MKKSILLICLLVGTFAAQSQFITVSNVVVTGRFNSCTGNNVPAVFASLISTSGGASVTGGVFNCLNPCDSSTIRVTITNAKWNKVPNAEWIHGIFLPAASGFSVSPIAIPNGYLTYNSGCTGLCPSGTGVNGGPGFYFDNTSSNSCCPGNPLMDGIPCNNFGDVSMSCAANLNLTFDLTFCNSSITSSSYSFVLEGSSDGETGCYNNNDLLSHKITFTIPTVPCNPPPISPSATAPVRTCVGATLNYTSTLSATCSGNSVKWWTAATGGSLIGTGSPFIYDPAGSACPAGTTLYATCCNGNFTTCVSRVPVTIPGSCNSLLFSGVTKTNSTCTLLGSINSVSVANSQGPLNYTLNPGAVSNTTGVFNGLNQTNYTVTVVDGGGCSVTSAVNIAQPPVVVFNPPVVTNVTCAQPASGQIVASATGGTGAISYSSNPSAVQSPSGTFTGLTSQTYTIIATDVNGCASQTTATVQTPPNPVWGSVNKTNLICNNVNSGSITASSPTAVNYTLLPSSITNTTGTFSGLAAGNYTVRATDANGCTVTSNVLITTPPPIVWNSFTVSNTTCSYLNNGSINTSASGGTGAIQYQLMPPGTTNSTGAFPNLSAGTYTVIARDGNNCTVTSIANLLAAPALVINSPTVTAPTCFGNSNGSISITATGGTGSLGYTILPSGVSNTTGVFSGLTVGTYTISVSDANSCTATSLVTMTQPPLLTISTTNVTHLICSGVSAGSITVAGNGGTGALTYLLQPGAISNASGIFSALSASTYTIRVTDANSCTSTTAVTVTQPPLLNWTSSNVTPVSCNAGNNGVISHTAAGGTGTLNYQIQPGGSVNTSGTFNTLTAGTYTIRVTDANGCSITTLSTITQPTVLAWQSVTKTNVLCFGQNTGAVNCSSTGGTLPYQFTLTPGGTTNSSGSFTGLAAGNYTVTVSDANACTIQTAVSITQPTLLSIINVNTTPLSCVPANNASISFSGSGGQSPYLYSIGGPNQAGNSFTNLAAGTYVLKVTDANGCTTTNSQTIAPPVPPTINTFTVNHLLCNAQNIGSINVTASGGSGALTYTQQPTGTTNSTGLFTNLSAASYTIVVTDAIGCTVSSTTTITQPAVLSWTTPTITPVACNGGSTGAVSVSVNGGTGQKNYTLQPGSITNTTGVFSGLSANTYTINVSDANACTTSTSVTITQPTLLNWTTGTQTHVSCFGLSNASLTRVASGGSGTLNYNLQPGNVNNTNGTFNGLPAGNYTVTVSDANACTRSTSITITQPTLLQINSVTNTIPTCAPGNDAQLSVTASGGTTSYQYSIGGPNQASNVFTNLGPGSYVITVTDANGCTVSSTQNIVAPGAPVINSANKTNVSCNGGNNGSVSVVASGGTGALTYTIQSPTSSNSTGVFNGLIAATYTVRVTDAVGCTVSTTVTVTQPSSLSWSTTNKTNLTCFASNNGSISTLAAGGTGSINYSLLPGSSSNTTGSFAGLAQGVYSITATDANGCTLTTSMTITQPTALTWSPVNAPPVSCFAGSNGSVSAPATGGTGAITYQIQPTGSSNGTGSFSGLPAGNYTITATDANACSRSTSVTITQPPLLQISSVTNTIPTCVPGNDAQMSITASGGTTSYQYSIGGPAQGSNVFTSLGAGSYVITVSDANGCTVSSTQNIVTPNSPVINSANKTNVSCNGGSNGTVTVTASGGTGALTYTILSPTSSNSTGAFTGLIAATYTVRVTDAVGCSVSTTVTVTQPPALSWSTTNKTNLTCFASNNGTISTQATGGTGTINYSLLPGSITNTTGSFSSLAPGVYSITATDANACTLTTSMTITQPTALSWSPVTVMPVTCFAGSNGSVSAPATGGTGAITYVIQPTGSSNGTGSFSGLPAGSYTITATDANACTRSTSMTITQPTLLQINSVTNTIPTCVPGNDAQLTITASGGTTSYQYSIGGPNQVSNVFTNLGSGSYVITVTDANGCTVSSTQNIVTPNSPVINTASQTHVSCNGGSNGSVTVTASSGTGALTYTIQSPTSSNGTGVFNGLIAATYTVRVTDAVGCSVSTTVTVTQPTALSWNSTGVTHLTCFASNNGTISSQANGGTGTINYSLLPGSSTNTTGSFSSLAPGVYSITATDANACTLTTSMTITQPTALSWSPVIVMPVTCFAGSNGSISAPATGGTGAITYVIQPTGSSNGTGSFSGLPAGNYTITATDANACTRSTSMTITQPTLLQINSVTNTIPTCVPGNDAQLTITASGGTTSYQYSIGGPNQVSNVFTNLGSGSFVITVTDANGCTVSSTQNIVTPNSPVINTASQTHVSCNGGSNGSVTVTASSGTGALTYTIQSPTSSNSTGVFNGLIAATYTVRVTDAVGCSVSTTVTVTQPTALSWNSTGVTHLTCFASNNGTISTQATGGTGTINYSLLPGSSTNTTGSFSSLAPGAYSITATDANGCTLTTSMTITQPIALSWSPVTVMPVTCFAGSNGSVSAPATGGTGAITYVIQPTGSSNGIGSFSGLLAGSYTITATDANNCSLTTAVSITQPTLLQINSITNTIPTCVPGNDAQLTITASGGTTSYQYSIGGSNQASNVFTNLGPGSYVITVTDANGCTVSSTQNIVTPNSPIINTASQTHVSCNGGSNGTVSVTASSGTGALTYTIQSPASSNSTGVFNGLIAATYTVRVTDAVGCSVNTTLTVTEPPALSWNSTGVTHLTCFASNNGTISTQAAGGTGTINYSILPGSSTNTTGAFTSLAPGAYSITATDANGCTLTTSMTITQPTAVSWSTVTVLPVTCFAGNDGSVSATATGGTGAITYVIQPTGSSNSSGSFSGLLAGTYTITATDANNCSLTTAISITQPTLLQINSITNTIPTCVPGNDAQLTITASGGTTSYQYSIGGPTQTGNVFTNLGSGSYVVTVTDANGCTVSSTQNIVTPNSPQINSANNTPVSCNGGNDGTVSVAASGGTGALTYALQSPLSSNSSGAFNGLIAATYTITVTDAVGCSVSTTVTVTEPTALSWNSTAVTHLTCFASNDGTISAQATGGTGIINYSIMPGGSSNTTGLFTSLAQGLYSITATDANGCTLTTSMTITEPSAVTWSPLTVMPVTCFAGNDGSVSAPATGGTGAITYVIQPTGSSNSSGSFSGLIAGNYTITATDANNCSLTTAISITQPTLLQINSVTNTIPTCVPGNDALLTITASGGTPSYQYSIGGPSQASNVFTNLGIGVFVITVTDANGCTVSTSQSIVAPNTPLINSAGSTGVSCNGGNDGTVSVAASGGTGALTYALQSPLSSNSSGAFNGLIAATYTITVTDAVGCSVSTTVTVTEPTALSWNSTAVTHLTCFASNDGTISAQATGGTGLINYSIMPGGSSNTTGLFTSLAQGLYSITATDANGCTLTTSMTITEPSAVTWSPLTVMPVTCFAGNDGSVSAPATGGTGAITYVIQPTGSSNSSGSFSGLIAGNYTITATDANNCSLTTAISITQPTLLQINSVTNTIPTCVPGNDAQLTITASGGTPSYQYSIGGPTQASNVFTNLGIGVFVITVTDANGCTVSTSQSIVAPNTPLINSAGSTGVSCNGGNDGTVSVAASGGTGALTYTLESPLSSNSSGAFNGLIAATYTITVTDAVGCSVSTTVTVTEPTALSWNSTAVTHLTCFASNDGTISAQATGGTGLINYSIMPGGSSNTSGSFASLAPGVYSITATDANGCTLTTSMDITEPTIVSWLPITVQPVSCFAGSNGSVSAPATGGTGAITYLIQPTGSSNSSGSFSGLIAGLYTITATDANNCSLTTAISITQPTLLQINSVTNTIPTCVPGNDAQLSIIANGGTPSYQYSIGGPSQSGNVFTNLGPAVYVITVTDANGCTVSTSQTIVSPNTPQISSVQTTDATCAPGSDGTIAVNATGGTGAYDYSLDGTVFQTANTFTGIAAGTYTVVVRDAAGCTNMSAVTILTLPSPQVNSIMTTEASCVPGCDGSLTVNASGGASGIFSYSIDNINFQPGVTFNSLCTGPYLVTVKDANGCTATSLTVINTANAPVINSVAVANVSCFGGNNGSITLTSTGGTGSITWNLEPGNISNGLGAFNTLMAANYTITATDINGCSVNTIQTITEPPLLEFSTININGTLCAGGSNGNVNAPTTGGTGAITYTISPSAVFVAPTGFTNLLGNLAYTITATDVNNCSTSTVVIIPDAPPIVVDSLSHEDVTCFNAQDGSINVSASGGTGLLTYQLQPGALSNTTGIFTGLSGNLYTITVVDANNCTHTSQVLLYEPPAILLNTLNPTNITCHDFNNGYITASSSGGLGLLTFTLQPLGISNTSGSFNSLAGNLYTLYVTDTTGCFISDTFSIINPPLLQINTLTVGNIICSGDTNASITIVASGGTGQLNYSCAPFGGTNTTGSFTNLPAGTYFIQISDANNCVKDTTVYILQPLPLIGTLDSTAHVRCFGGNDGFVQVSAAGGYAPYQFALNPGTAVNSSGSFSGLTAGTYTVIVTDSIGCARPISQILVGSPSPVVWDNVIPTNVTCYGDSNGALVVSAVGGVGNFSYSMIPVSGVQISNGNFSGIRAGTYTVVASDANNCSTSTLVIINQNPIIDFTRIDLKSPICHGDKTGSISASVNGGLSPFTFQLNGGTPVGAGYFGTLPAGQYTLTVKDASGCESDTVLNLTQPGKLTPKEIVIEDASCESVHNGTIEVNMSGGSGPLIYYLIPDLFINRTGVFSGLGKNEYDLTVRDSLGCVFDTTIHIDIAPGGLEISTTKKDLSCNGTAFEGEAYANINGGQPPYTYTWSTNPPQYTAGIQNLNFGYYRVEVTDADGCKKLDTVYVKPGDCCEKVFLPNAFSPNGDNNNDVFKVTSTAGIDLLKFEVYDRWGNLVWRANSHLDGWDGRYRNNPAEMATYYYVFWYTCLTDGQKYMRKGDLMLLR